MSWRTGLVALACALTAVAGAAPAASAQDKRVPWLGIMADGPLTAAGDPYASEWDLLGDSGVSFVRTAFYWNQVQAGGRDAAPDWTATDQVVGHAAQQGLEILPVVLGTPDWAAKQPGEGAVPSDNADYTAFLRLLVARYGPGGEYWGAHPELAAQPIRDWQVWNEPSLRLYWNEKAWAKGYVKLLQASHTALHRADPGATVVLAGLPNYSWRDLDRLYALGARRSFDVAALHPYTGSPSGVLTITRRNRKVMNAHGDRGKRIWLTETTWPSSKGKRPGAQGWETTNAGQAKRVRQAFPRLITEGRKLGVRRISWYTWLSEPNGKRWESYAGLRELRGGKVVAKPAYGAFVKLARKLAR
jgi:hypothetical protein